MKVYYPNTLKIVKDFNRTEEALRCRAWAMDLHDFVMYGYSRIPMSFVKRPEKSLKATSYDYNFQECKDEDGNWKIGKLTSASGQKWELHFEDDKERQNWKQYHFAARLLLPQDPL